MFTFDETFTPALLVQNIAKHCNLMWPTVPGGQGRWPHFRLSPRGPRRVDDVQWNGQVHWVLESWKISKVHSLTNKSNKSNASGLQDKDQKWQLPAMESPLASQQMKSLIHSRNFLGDWRKVDGPRVGRPAVTLCASPRRSKPGRTATPHSYLGRGPWSWLVENRQRLVG